MNIKLTEQQKIKILNSDHVYAIMQKVLLRENIIDQEKEHFWIIGMANSNMILFIELVSLGSAKTTVVEPMNVFRVAVQKGATKVILTHNHPGDGLLPSEEDKDMTDRLIQVGRILDVVVIDHLIITTKSFLSFADTGLFQELCESLKWVPPYELIERIRKEEQIIRQEAVAQAEEREEQALKEKEQALEREKVALREKAKERAEKEEALKREEKLKEKLKQAGIEPDDG